MKINKANLVKALEIVSPGLSNKDQIEHSSSFAFIGDRVVTYNDEISISHPVEGLNITGAIKADEFYKFLHKIKKEEVEVTAKESELIFKVGKIQAGIRLETEVRLPLNEIGDIGGWLDLPDNFNEALAFVGPVAGHDALAPILTCVNIHKDGYMEASDSYKLVKYEMIKEMPVDTFLLPAVISTSVVKLKPVQVAEGSGWVHFKTREGTIISCRIFSDTYPTTTGAILKVKGAEVTLPETMNEIIDRASVFSKRESTFDESVSIYIDNNRISVESKSDAGWFKEKATIEFDGEPISFDITPSLLRNILKETRACVVNAEIIKFETKAWEYVAMLRAKPKIKKNEVKKQEYVETDENDLPF